MDHAQILRDLDDATAVLVSDFDGTLAHPDFYQLVRARLVPRTTPDFWQEYRNGTSSHFDALRKYFYAAEGGEAALVQVLDDIALPDDLTGLVARLRDSGWSVVVVSAGCQWYIDRLLNRAGCELPVITNPGKIEDDRLVMRRPDSSPFRCDENGVNKRAVVEQLLGAGKRVAYCGDGYTDLPAATLVDASRRYARADLADALDDEQLGYRPFSRWHDVVHGLLPPRS
ncbi:MAG: HAD-IB family phosphatase [Planctomycetota bacterium]